MERSEVKIGVKVTDKWFSQSIKNPVHCKSYGDGVITEVLKTIFKVKFENLEEEITYDYSHRIFLEIINTEKTFKISGVEWIDGSGNGNFYLDLQNVRILINPEKALEIREKLGIEFKVQLSDAYMQN